MKKLKVLILSLQIMLGLNINAQAEVWLNIFVHGIIKTPFSINDFTKIAHNCVEGTQHYHMVDYLRDRSELYLYQPMQKKGLIKIDPKTSSNGAAAISKLYDYQFNNLTSVRFNQDNYTELFNLYYTFGWSGYLSRLHRELDAKKLYKALFKEIDNLKKKNITPKIRLIGFSHGSNVILNIANCASWNENSLPFKIDETIFLAVPIHKESDENINHPIFKKVYSFYSRGDIAQKADFFSTQYLFSHRKFGRKNFDVPRKLTQVQIRATNIFFNKCGNIERQYHISPNHMDFWNFGWAPKRCKTKSPLKPFSIISLIPFLINSIKSIDDLSSDITLDIIPQLEKILITDNNHSKCIPKQEYSLPFISKYDFNEMKKICFQFKSFAELYKFDKKFLVKNAMSYALCKRTHSTCGCLTCSNMFCKIN